MDDNSLFKQADQEIQALLKDGELIRAFEKASQTYADKLDRYCQYRLIHYETDFHAATEDLVQQLFLELWQWWQAQEHIDYRVPVSGFLFQRARQRIIDEWRRRSFRREELRDDMERLRQALDHSQCFANDELVRYAFSQLSPEDADLLMMVYIEERPYEEIAQLLGISEKTLRVRVHRARQRMRKIIEDEL